MTLSSLNNGIMLDLGTIERYQMPSKHCIKTIYESKTFELIQDCENI